MALASALRSLPSSSAISPKNSPGCMIPSTSSLPSGDGALMRTDPLSRAIMLSPGSPIRKIVSPALNVRVRTRVTSARRSSALNPRNNTHSASSRRASSSVFCGFAVMDVAAHC
jgi:hypothetical protein